MIHIFLNFVHARLTLTFINLIQKLMRDKMEESGYDIPIDLIDCITTNYLSKKSPPSSPKESAANSLGQSNI